jgi:SAM-dependent methyltransferase
VVAAVVAGHRQAPNCVAAMVTITDALDMTVVDIYTAGDEEARMIKDRNQLEWIRTCELLKRWLPSAPAKVIDIGGGPGRQARHLLDLGYDVTLYDLVPRHIQQATTRGLTAHLADARNLPTLDATAEIVLELGPLYHLPHPEDRAKALAEAWRVCALGGIVVVAALSRWARPLVRASQGQLADPEWHRHTISTLLDGHVEEGDAWDACTYLHTPDELGEELRAAGFTDVTVTGIEGPIGPWARIDPTLTDKALQIARAAEAYAGSSIHMLAKGRKAG